MIFLMLSNENIKPGKIEIFTIQTCCMLKNHLYMRKTKTSDANYLLNHSISLNFRKEMYVEWLRLTAARKGVPYETGQIISFYNDFETQQY